MYGNYLLIPSKLIFAGEIYGSLFISDQPGIYEFTGLEHTLEKSSIIRVEI